MGGELSFDGLIDNGRKWAGRIIGALGFLTVLASIVVTYTSTQTAAAITALIGFAVLLASSHIRWEWRTALNADGFVLALGGFPLRDLVGGWAYLLVAVGVLLIVRTILAWRPHM